MNQELEITKRDEAEFEVMELGIKKGHLLDFRGGQAECRKCKKKLHIERNGTIIDPSNILTKKCNPKRGGL